MDITKSVQKGRRFVASLSVVTMIASMLVSNVAHAQTFSDVPTDAWFYSYVEQLVAAGVLDSSKATFDPAKTANRAEAAKMLVLAANLPLENPAVATFTDVKSTAWFYQYVETAAASNIVGGYKDASGNLTGFFGPGDVVTREQFAKMAMKALAITSNTAGGPHFGDVPADRWSYENVETLYNNSVVDGYPDGTFGPAKSINRAEIAKMVVNAQDPHPRAVTPPGPTPGPVVGGALSASKASETPGVGTLATKTANNTLLVVQFNGGSSASQVTGMTVMKTGIYNDSSVKVVAYDKDGVRLSSGVTFSDGKAMMSFYAPVMVAAGGTAKVWIKVSITGTSSGTLGLKVNSATDVMSNASSVSGSFPLESATMNVVDGTSSVAAATVDSTTIATTARTVDIGETNYELAKFKVCETSSKEELKLASLTLFNNGSVADGDLQNFTLVDQSNVMLAKVQDQVNKLVRFDLKATPYNIPKGTCRTFSVKVDVVNGATRTGQLIVQNDFDAELIGASTQSSILATADSGGTDTSFPIGDNSTTYNSISINEGSLTVSKANVSPSGDITIGANDAVLGSFEMKALGEDIELQRLKIDLSSNAVSTGAQNTTGTFECSSSSACDLTGSVKVMVDENLDGIADKSLLTVSAAPTTVADMWNINSLANQDLSAFYTIKAGKTVNVMIIGSITSSSSNTASGENIKVGLKDVYHYKKSSLKYGTSATTLVQANQMTVTTSALTVSSNTGYGAQTIVSQSGAHIGSLIVKAGSAEGVDITSIALTGSDCAAGTATGYTNVWLKKLSDGKQLGTTKGTVTLDNNVTSNTYSVSGFSLPIGGQEQIDVYADMSSAATNVCLQVPVAGVAGTGKVSISSVTGPTSALSLQTITATSSGNLTISLANDTSVSREYVAGSVDNKVMMLKFAASNAEDLYIKKLRFRGLLNASDVGIKQAKLWTGTNPTALTQVGGALSWQSDGSNPGFVEWTLSGADRLKVPKNGTLYAALSVDFVSSDQATVTGLLPQFVLGNVEAEGLSTISASGTGGNLVNASGIIVQAVGSATYVDSVQNTAAAITSATATTVTTDGGTFQPGDVIFIDQNADATWDPSSEELMTVVLDGGADLTVQRGAFGTTAQAAYSTAKDIYVLNTSLASVNGVQGNQMLTFDTKPDFTVAADSPSGVSGGGSNKIIFKFNAFAENNAADPAENKVTLTYVDITTAKSSGLTVQNLVVYPSDSDLDSNFVTTCVALTATKWRCTLNSSSGKNQVIENTTRTYIARADVGTITTTATYSLTPSIASLGNNGVPGDVSWSDGTTTSTWVNQVAPLYNPSEVRAPNSLTYNQGEGASVSDTTAPTISSIVLTDATADNALTVGATIAITFSERMDPTTIGSTSLIPGGSAVAVSDGATGDISVAGNNGAASGNDMLTIKNIANIDMGATTFATGALTGADTATLNSAGTVLTLTVTTALTGAGADGTESFEPASAATTMKDVTGNAATSTGSNGATVTFGDV